MADPLTPERLAEIREWLADWFDANSLGPSAATVAAAAGCVRDLLAELDRVRAAGTVTLTREEAETARDSLVTLSEEWSSDRSVLAQEDLDETLAILDRALAAEEQTDG
jgi:hypothetical protein